MTKTTYLRQDRTYKEPRSDISSAAYPALSQVLAHKQDGRNDDRVSVIRRRPNEADETQKNELWRSGQRLALESHCSPSQTPRQILLHQSDFGDEVRSRRDWVELDKCDDVRSDGRDEVERRFLSGRKDQGVV